MEPLVEQAGAAVRRLELMQVETMAQLTLVQVGLVGLVLLVM
tara:strand:+ start:665 stop:790 length:126 start_codon:yes stop_codon:yes gene_type:complete